jgi:PAS domain S-box-containing protein
MDTSPESIDAPLPLPAPERPSWLNGGMAVLSPDGTIRACNDALGLWLGEPETSIEGRLLTEILGRSHPIWAGLVETWLREGGRFTTLLLPGESAPKGGWIRINAARSDTGLFVHVDSTLPPRMHLEEDGSGGGESSEDAGRALRLRLLRTEAQLDNLMRRWPGVIFSQRADMSFHYASPKLEDLTGVPLTEWTTRPETFWSVIHEADLAEVQQQIRRAAQSGVSINTSFRVRHARTGRVAYVLEHRHALRSDGGLLLGFEGVWLDVSRQTIAERRLSSAAWRDTLAVLTMGLAHDFGNILAGIHALAETLEPPADGDAALQDGMDLIKRNAMQASQLVRRVLSLHQGRPGEYAYSDLNEQVTDLAELVRKVIPRRIQFTVEASPKALPVYVDAVELRQVFLNLAMNAVDAMPHSGRLRCTTARHTEVPPLVHVQGVFPRLPAVCLAVEDNGLGIPSRNLGNIFDPFFTTKPVNKGSGLGLYNARLFVEKHHGAISVDSTEGVGTTFRLWLPEADFTEEERSQEQAGHRRRSLLVVGASGRPLDTTTEFLRRSGYFVVTESREDHALQLLDSLDYEFDAVLVQVSSDPTERTGQLLRDVRQRRPPVKSILQIVGRNADEVDTGWIRSASLTIPPDLPEREFGEKLRELFETAA